MVSIENQLHGNFRALQDAFEVSADSHTVGKTEIAPNPWQVERDTEGRIWYDIPGSTTLPAALTETSPRRAILTKSGQQFLQELERPERRRVLQSTLDRKLSGEQMRFNGTEGRMRKVDDLPYNDVGWMKTIIGALRNTNVPMDHSIAKLTAVEKTFQQRGAFYGWEMAYLIDQLHLAGRNVNLVIQEMTGVESFRILQPLGGTHRDLYMPFLEGHTLEEFFDCMYELHPSLAKLITVGVQHYTSLVHRAIYMNLLMILGQHGYEPNHDRRYEGHFQDGYSHFLRTTPQGDRTILDVFIDMHPMGRHPYDRYRNLMLSPEVYTACWQIAEDSVSDSDKVEQISSLINTTAIIFDPLYIRQRRGKAKKATA